MNILLFPWIIFLRFMSYLLWCSSFKKLLYTKLKQMLWGFSRTWPFLDTCSRTRVTGSEASPVIFGTPLTLKLSLSYFFVETLYAGSYFEVQSNSIIVESIIVENSIIVDNLVSTEDFYSIKIQNSRNSKIVELFLGKVAWNLVFFCYFLLNFQ